MRIRFAALFLCLSFTGTAPAQESAVVPAFETTEETLARIARAADNLKKNDEALLLFERIERVETRKKGGDLDPADVKISRVVPAGTGTARIPVGPEGQPANAAAYRQELEKLEHFLVWASETGRAQRDAYEKIAKKQRDRNELIEATRSAFLYTYLASEPRGGRILLKYRMEPNPAYQPVSRATSILLKVRGLVWIDEAAGQLARIEADVTDDISFGGFLAKIYKGSHFMQERYEVAPGVWLPSFSQYDFDGRKFFSSVAVHERTFATRFRRVGPPKEALEIIRGELSKANTHNADP